MLAVLIAATLAAPLAQSSPDDSILRSIRSCNRHVHSRLYCRNEED